MFSRRVIASRLPTRHATRAAATATGPTSKAADKAAEVMGEATANVRGTLTDAASTASKNPLLTIGAGIATALVGYTAFCYSKEEQPLGDTYTDDNIRRAEPGVSVRSQAQRNRTEQLTKELTGRFSIVGHTEARTTQPSPKITGSDFEFRKIEAAGNVGDIIAPSNRVWLDEYVNVSIHDRGHRTSKSDAISHAGIPDARGRVKRDAHMNVLVHEQEVHMPGTSDEMERTDRLDAEAATPPKFLTDRTAQTLQGFRLTSREYGNEESNTAASPGEIKRDIKPLMSEGSSRVYAKKEDITKADNRSLDGGAKASRDGQAMMDYAKRIASLP